MNSSKPAVTAVVLHALAVSSVKRDTRRSSFLNLCIYALLLAVGAVLMSATLASAKVTYLSEERYVQAFNSFPEQRERVQAPPASVRSTRPSLSRMSATDTSHVPRSR
jgi:hypothetical protein